MSEDLWNTIKSLEEERDKFAKKERGKTFERRPQKFDVHEHAKLDLHELAAVRQVPPGRLAGRILEEVVSLWAKNATDRNLYLKRVENPREADIEISQESAKGLVMDMGNSETFTLNLLTQVVMHYYENGGQGKGSFVSAYTIKSSIKRNTHSVSLFVILFYKMENMTGEKK